MNIKWKPMDIWSIIFDEGAKIMQEENSSLLINIVEEKTQTFTFKRVKRSLSCIMYKNYFEMD